MIDSTATVVRPHEAWLVQTYSPSRVRVLVKSLYLLAFGWLATVAFLWIAMEQTGISGINMLTHAVIPALCLQAGALTIDHWAKALLPSGPHGHEWGAALSWTIVPMMFLIVSAALIVG